MTMMIIRVDDAMREKEREARVHVLLHGYHLLREPLLMRAEQIANLIRAVMRSIDAADGVRVVAAKGILVGGDDAPGGRIESRGQLIEGNEALPFILAGTAVHRYASIPSPADGQHAGCMVADVAVAVGVDDILAGID